MWIARNKDGNLKLFAKVEPWRDYDCSEEEQHWITDEPTNTECYLDSSLFPKLKWENEPVEVDLIPKEKVIELEECKQTIKVLQKLYKVSDKTLDLHTKHTVCWNDLTEDEKSNTMLDIVSSRSVKSGYPSQLVDENFDELI